MLRCIEDIDAETARRLWAHVAPGMPQPTSTAEAVIILHMARAQSQAVRFRLRAYSHRWLVDNGYPSPLPDEMRPRAERMYPTIVEGVGISVNARNHVLRPVTEAVQSAMSDAVMDAYESGRRDPEFVRARMSEAREKSKKYFSDVIREASAYRDRRAAR